MTFTIDVHHHILPDVFWRATNDAHNPVGGISPAPWSKESTLSYTDDAGIDVAITSISTPGVHMGDDAAARDLARRVNEISAELIKERPDRFGGFAALPLPDVDGALRALEHGLDVLELDGVVLFSNARGIYLGDARFRPLFDELERRAAVVSVHPTSSPDAAAAKSNRAQSCKPMKPAPFWPATRSNCSRGLQATRRLKQQIPPDIRHRPGVTP